MSHMLEKIVRKGEIACVFYSFISLARPNVAFCGDGLR